MRALVDAEHGTGVKAVLDDAILETPNISHQETVLETPLINMKQGIKFFCEAEMQAVKQEMQQLHDRKVMRAKEARELTREQKKEVLAYSMFLKRKHGRNIKGRG